MSDTEQHDVMAIRLEEGVPVGDVDLGAVRSGLQSDRNTVRIHAAEVAAGIATDDSDEAAVLVPDLAHALDDELRTVVYQTTIATTQIAEDHPLALEPAIDPLVDTLDHDLPLVRTLAARSLGFVALERPDLFVEHVDTLVDVTRRETEDVVSEDAVTRADLDPEQRQSLQQINKESQIRQLVTRAITANLLVEVAAYDPDALAPYADEFVELLDDDDTSVAVPSADVVATLAEADVADLSHAVDPLCDLLDHEDEGLAANAVTALGFVGDARAVGPLRDLAAADDADEDLRELADRTAGFIDDA